MKDERLEIRDEGLLLLRAWPWNSPPIVGAGSVILPIHPPPSLFPNPSSLISNLSSFIFHLSSFIFHPSSFLSLKSPASF